MKYQKTVNIWNTAPESLQVGQWVTAGSDPTSKGIYLGVKPSGSVVVAWYMNAKGQRSFRKYIQTLRHYARGTA
jgi:hypothetical protein